MATDTTLTSYVPYVVARSLAGDPAPITSPSVDHFAAAVLIADISGFTPLAERLAERGPAGAEELTALLNTYFGQLVDLITAHGGDVLKFAGDALLAIWPAISEDLPAVARRAAQCALAAQQSLHGYEAAEGVRLSLRIGVGTGDVLLMVVGGVHGRWEVLVAGRPFPEISAAKNGAQPGEVMLTRSAWQLVQRFCVGRTTSGGNVRLDALLAPAALRAAEMVVLQREAESTLRAFVPDAILSRLAAGQTGWLAELRRVSVLFLSISGIDYGGPQALEQVQSVLAAMQDSLAHYRGTIRQFLVDDKGTVLIAAFGLPPRAQEDDAIRAVQAGQMMQANLQQLGLEGAMGITTGRAFCGPVGNALRREYAMVGDVVNLSARLMEAAQDGILCDAATYEAARGRVAFDALPEIAVKGKAEQVAVYRPRGQARLPVRTQPIVGRTAEREFLLRQVQGLLRGSGGGVVLIEGEAGIGKSRLVDEVRRWADALGVRAWVGAGDASERSLSYHAWAPVASKLFKLDNLADRAARAERVAAMLQSSPELLQLGPLLNELLLIDLPETETTRAMSAETRAAALQELLARLLMISASRAPTVLILEDAQSLDAASWGLALTIAQRQSGAARAPLLVIATRPLPEPQPAGYTQILRAPNTRRLWLQPLPPAETLLLVCRRLGVGSLPEQVSSLIVERAKGNPFFSEEIAYALRDNGLITVSGGECRVAPGVGDLRAVTLPDTVQRAIIGRMDLLPPRLQLILKVASVIGRVFPLRALRDIHPIPADKERLASDLMLLQRLDLTALHTTEPELTYVFKDDVTREVAYGLLLFAQRRELHRQVAEWYEKSYAADPDAHYGTLAHHWSKAEEYDRALDYLEKAGNYALRRFANQEAVEYLRQALELHASGAAAEPLRRAAWERHLGESYYRLGRLAESREHFEIALTLLKQPIPRPEPGSRGAELAKLVGQAMRQMLSRGQREPAAPRQGAPPANLGIVEAIGAYERLSQIHYLNHQVVPGLHAALRALNLAEAARQPAELARSYATAALATGIVGQFAPAEEYARQALLIAEPLGHLSTLAYVLEVTGTYWAGVGKWSAARDALGRAVEIADRLGDRRRWEESLANLADVAYYQGEFQQSAGLRDQIYAAAQTGGVVAGQVWGLVGLLPSLLALDKVSDEALAMVEALAGEDSASVEAYASLSVALLRRGDAQSAGRMAETAAGMLARVRPTAHYSLAAYSGLAEVFLTLLEAGRPSARQERRRLQEQARNACAALFTFARVFPIGEPRAWLWQGLYEWLTGHKSGAVRAWNKSLAAAQRLQMPYDGALASFELARHQQPADPARQEHLASAFNTFSRLGAAYDLKRLQQLG